MSQPRRFHPLRTAQDFDNRFQEPDPWRVKGTKLFEWRNRLIYQEFRKYFHSRGSKPRVLELGCGEGYFTRWISAEVELTVNDISSVALSRVEGVKHKILADALELVKDSQFLSEFDCILALDMLYYLRPKEREEFLDYLERGMSPGAFLLVFLVVSDNEIHFFPGEFETMLQGRQLRLIKSINILALTGLRGRILNRAPERIKSWLLKKIRKIRWVGGDRVLHVLRKE